MGLWDNVSGFTAIERLDDDNLARDSMTRVAEFSRVSHRPGLEEPLPNDWTRVLVGNIQGDRNGGSISHTRRQRPLSRGLYRYVREEGLWFAFRARQYAISAPWCTNWVTRS